MKLLKISLICLIVFIPRLTLADTVCTLIYDLNAKKMLAHTGTCNQALSPASTFKIALSLMGYDSNYLTNENLPNLPFHPHYVDDIPKWKQTINPKKWLSYSVVWYSQLLTEWLGKERFQDYVSTFQYGNEDVSGDPDKENGLSRAWLGSSLKITPLQQLGFLVKILNHELPVSEFAYKMTEKNLFFSHEKSGWCIFGKTGQITLKLDKKFRVAWYVGWAKKDNRTLIFVQNYQSNDMNVTAVKARDNMISNINSLQ